MDQTASLIAEAQAFIDSTKLPTPAKANKHDTSQNRVLNRLAREQTPDEEEEQSFSPANFSLPKTIKSDNPLDFFPVRTVGKNDIVAYIEQYFITNRTLPNRSEIHTRFPTITPDIWLVPEWDDLLAEISPLLQSRGIRPYTLNTPDALEPNFILAVNLITNPYDRRNLPAKLKECGLSSRDWKNLLLIPKNLEFYQEHLNKIFDEQTQLDAKLALQKLVSAGDLNAIKHYHELQNIYRPQQDMNAMLVLVFQSIMEILTLHVNPTILSTVATEIRGVIEANSQEKGAA